MHNALNLWVAARADCGVEAFPHVLMDNTLQVIAKPHFLLVTLVLCNAAATEVRLHLNDWSRLMFNCSEAQQLLLRFFTEFLQKPFNSHHQQIYGLLALCFTCRHSQSFWIGSPTLWQLS